MVVENIARKFGISESELLDREADDLAVRIALGETQVIADTKRALSKAGINVSSLEEFASGKTGGLKRSNHVILVIFVEAAEARASFKGLAYKRYDKTSIVKVLVVKLEMICQHRDAPLYLEWAPGNILSPNPTSAGDSNDNVIVDEHDSNRVLLEQQLEDITDMDIDPDRIEVISGH
ncbi:Hypothetical predicted protein [Olea europaea subsp. europaea]|uniref:Uncharacterized protein n=1 Tax=Olea europaea subsp. europaea TaxID=158383 RepID=A0A8S0QZX3_OLEEU|nr:Hypothetical predicted protein [Olea europaea subsp. europaea]